MTQQAIAILLELYEEGMSLAGMCRGYLESAEQKVVLINQDNAIGK